MNTLIFVLICYGACNNMIYGSIFERWRIFLSTFGTGGYSLYKLFTCFMCLGTWMGFAVSFIMIKFDYVMLTPLGSIGVDDKVLNIFLSGLLSGGTTWLIHNIEEMFERAFKK